MDSTALTALLIGNIIAPLMVAFFQRRGERSEANSAAVPLLVQKLDALAEDVRELRNDMRVTREHEAEIAVLGARVTALESSGRAAVHLAHDRSE